MSKTFTTEIVVEYAYLDRVVPKLKEQYEENGVKKTKHVVYFHYDLKDSNRQPAALSDVQRTVEREVITEGDQLLATVIAENLEAWVLADKLALSGYTV